MKSTASEPDLIGVTFKMELEFAMLAFEPRKGSTRRKVSRSRELEKENNNILNPHQASDEARTRTQAILVGSECSHSALPSPADF